MTEEDAKKIAGYLASLSESARYRATLQRVTRSIAKWLGILALATTVATVVLNGTDFFTKTVPAVVAFMSKQLLLSHVLRPYLIRQVAVDLGYQMLCVCNHQVIDLDGDREATDLIVEFYPSARDCERKDDDVIYVMLKESEWKGFFPKYTLLRTFSLNSLANHMTFTKEGAFLVGSVVGPDIAGYVVYGYANGLLHGFGGFQPLGNFVGEPPRGQIGNRLFFATSQGLMSFEVRSNGEFSSTRMSAREIVERNDTALIIEDERMLRPTDKVPFANGLRNYTPATQTLPRCFSEVFNNGQGIVFTERNETDNCVARLKVNRATTIIANVRCKYEGFYQSRQFPWGKVYDPSVSSHSIKCPENDDDGSYQYELIIESE